MMSDASIVHHVPGKDPALKHSDGVGCTKHYKICLRGTSRADRGEPRTHVCIDRIGTFVTLVQSLDVRLFLRGGLVGRSENQQDERPWLWL